MKAVVALLWFALQGGGPPELERWFSELDRALEPLASEARAHLVALGAAAGQRALSGLGELPLSARRARSRLLSELGDPELAPGLLGGLADPDPEVRRFLVKGLGSPGLAENSAAERLSAFEELALADPDHAVRAQARAALLECALPSAAPVFERLLTRLPPEEAREIAAGFAELPTARERLIAYVARAAEPATLGAPEVLVALLRGYGRALAEVPHGGEERAERRPLLRLRLHTNPAVAAAARGAFAAFVARAAELEEGERAERVLAHFGDEGWPLVECLRRRIDLAWFERGDAAHALRLAEELERTSRRYAPVDGEAWELRARLLQGAAHYALGDGARARELFDELETTLLAERRAAPERFPSALSSAPSAGAGEAALDTLGLLALVDLWQALAALGEEPERVRASLRSAHLRFLEGRAVALRTRADDPRTLDVLLERELSPYALVLFNQRFASARHGAALDQALALGRVWGEVAPLEMIGLRDPLAAQGAPDDVFADPERFQRLEELRTATLDELQRQWDELDALAALAGQGELERFEAERQIKRLGGYLRQIVVEERDRLRKEPTLPRREVCAQLLDYLATSMHAHTLAGHLRAEDRTAEALALCERALETLRTAPLGSSNWSELSAARFGILRGSILMDQDRPKDAETAYLESERRLAAIEASLEQWIGEAGSPEGLRQYQNQIQDLRGDALLSLAVNANVRLRDPARALEFFERAFELNQNPFMRILRACYRARSGKAEEARTVLASVVPVPALYYNIACTYALLGDKDQALAFLEHDFQVNCPSTGSRAQKRAWAAKDPDLASLRDEPRFQRLVGGS